LVSGEAFCALPGVRTMWALPAASEAAALGGQAICLPKQNDVCEPDFGEAEAIEPMLHKYGNLVCAEDEFTTWKQEE